MQWHKFLKTNFFLLEKLSIFLQWPKNWQSKISSTTTFPLNIPYRLASKIQKGSLDDPILKQFIPLKSEEIKKASFTLDPLQERKFQKKNILYKYPNRALLFCSSSCAMHCRFCFRRHTKIEQKNDFSEEIKWIEENKQLSEIILSGADPLMLSTKELEKILIQLDSISHIQRIRIHTRMIIGIPERIDQDLLDLLQKIKKQIFVVIHVNHPKELDEDIFLNIKKLQKLGIIVLNQSVLLKGINDDPKVLYDLSEQLSNHGILPYYLHQIDKVEGASHMEVDKKRGIILIQKLREKTSGYAIPKYVQEIPRQKSKTSLTCD